MSRRIITTEITEEDKRIESSLRPQYLDEYIGQEKIKSTLKVFIDAAKSRGELLTMSCFTALRVSARRHSAALLRMRWA
mgnify:FL=1